MGIQGGVVRFVFSASNTGGEVINTGFWVFLNTSTPSQADLDTLTTDAATLWNVQSALLQGFCYAGVSWQQVKSYYYDGTGPGAALQSVKPLLANAGTQITGGSPIDTCLVVSLRTGLPGRTKRGRMYLPLHSAVSATSGQVPAATCTAFSNAVAGTFNSWNGAHPGFVSVVSRTSTSSAAVTQCQTNSVTDVQRRRENKLVPNNNALATVTP